MSVMCLSLSTVLASFIPSPLIRLDPYFSHHVIIAEKSTHKLFIFKNSDGVPTLVKEYQMVSGKKKGDKFFQGDHRTPEGIYYMTRFIPHSELIKMYGSEIGSIYGAGAFVMNYPNPLDYRSRKTGGGIWLHSTNDETRIEKGLDSRGCLVIANNDLKEVSKFIELNKTPIIVVHDLNYRNKTTYKKRNVELLEFLNSWKESWEKEELKTYLSHYDKKNYQNKYRTNYNGLKSHKKRVFSRKGTPSISISTVTILEYKNYSMAIFLQNYNSKNINDIGKKVLYLKKDEFYNWKIVEELWFKVDEEIRESFIPSNRFFTHLNQGDF